MCPCRHVDAGRITRDSHLFGIGRTKDHLSARHMNSMLPLSLLYVVYHRQRRDNSVVAENGQVSMYNSLETITAFLARKLLLFANYKLVYFTAGLAA